MSKTLGYCISSLVFAFSLNVQGMKNITKVKEWAECKDAVNSEINEKTLVIFDCNDVLLNGEEPNEDVVDVCRELTCRKLCLTVQWNGSKERADKTLQELDGFGCDFSKNWPKNLPNGNIMHPDLNEGMENAVYQNGVIVCGQMVGKGTALEWFLLQFKDTPSNIIFIDDILGSLEQVEYTCCKLGIPFTGIQYRGINDSYDENWDRPVSSEK